MFSWWWWANSVDWIGVQTNSANLYWSHTLYMYLDTLPDKRPLRHKRRAKTQISLLISAVRSEPSVFFGILQYHWFGRRAIKGYFLLFGQGRQLLWLHVFLSALHVPFWTKLYLKSKEFRSLFRGDGMEDQVYPLKAYVCLQVLSAPSFSACTQLIFFINLQRAVIGPSATWQADNGPL